MPPVRAQRTVTTLERGQRGVGLNSAAEGYRWRGIRLIHPHGSGYKPLHWDLEEAAGGGVLTGEAVRVVATDDDGNGSQVGEGAPNPTIYVCVVCVVTSIMTPRKDPGYD
jgi:hypothetical protein